MNRIFKCIIVIIIVSCNRDFSPLESKEEFLVSLSVGNKYRYFQKSLHDDWTYSYEIIGDTVIDNKKYIVRERSDGYLDFIRLKNDVLYQRYLEDMPIGGWMERVEFDFNLLKGDTSHSRYIGPFAVDSIYIDIHSGQSQKIFICSSIYGPDTLLFSNKLLMIYCHRIKLLEANIDNNYYSEEEISNYF